MFFIPPNLYTLASLFEVTCVFYMPLTSNSFSPCLAWCLETCLYIFILKEMLAISVSENIPNLHTMHVGLVKVVTCVIYSLMNFWLNSWFTKR